jgi:hypothetical protein
VVNLDRSTERSKLVIDIDKKLVEKGGAGFVNPIVHEKRLHPVKLK